MPRFSRMGLPDRAAASSKEKILHVTRADLQDVRIFSHHGDIRLGQNFRHDSHPKLVAGVCQYLQAFETQTLKSVRRAAWFECATAEDAHAPLTEMVCRGYQLEFGFHRTRSSRGDEVSFAKLDVEHRDNRPTALVTL